MLLRQQIITVFLFAVVLVLGAILIRWNPVLGDYLIYSSKNLTQRQRQQYRLETIMRDNTQYRIFYNKYMQYYSRMSEAQRDDLQNFRKKIESDPQGAALSRTLSTYYAWLKTVGEADREKIEETKNLEERIKAIREIKEHQDRIQGARSQDVIDHELREEDSPYDDAYDSTPTDRELASFLEKTDPRHRQFLLGLPPEKFFYQLLLDFVNARKTRQNW